MNLKQAIINYLEEKTSKKQYAKLLSMIPGKDDNRIRKLQSDIKATEEICNELLSIIKVDELSYKKPKRETGPSLNKRLRDIDRRVDNLKL